MFCIFNDSGMGILGRTLRRIFCRSQGIDSVSYIICTGSPGCTGNGTGSGMAAGRCIKCIDGYSESRGGAVIITGGYIRNKTIY